MNFRPVGPLNGWEYLRKMSPAITTIRATAEHVNAEMKTLSRGKKHTSPGKEADVIELVKAYMASKIHNKSEQQKGHKRAKVADFVADGYIKLGENKNVKTWESKRKHYRSTREVWSDDEGLTSN